MKRISIIVSAIAVLASCSTKEAHNINVIPYPNEVKVMSGTFNAAGASFHIDQATDQLTQDLINTFAAQLEHVSGQESAVDYAKGDGFTFALNRNMATEEYSIKVIKSQRKPLVRLWVKKQQSAQDAPTPRQEILSELLTLK